MVPPLVQFLLFGSIFEALPRQITRAGGTFPTTNYYEYIAPAIVFFVCVLGIANAGVALVNDFQNGDFNKLLLAPVSVWSILLGRLLSDGTRIFIQSGIMLAFALLFGARVETGFLGALLMLTIAVLFSIFTVGVLVANVAIKTKDAQAVQAIFPLFFILIFLTTAFLPKEAIGSEVVKSIISGNPAQAVIQAMQGLMLTGYDWQDIGIALGVIALFALLGVGLTRLNVRALYR
jgi:ABC-2 type transport system permease protein